MLAPCAPICAPPPSHTRIQFQFEATARVTHPRQASQWQPNAQHQRSIGSGRGARCCFPLAVRTSRVAALCGKWPWMLCSHSVLRLWSRQTTSQPAVTMTTTILRRALTLSAAGGSRYPAADQRSFSRYIAHAVCRQWVQVPCSRLALGCTDVSRALALLHNAAATSRCCHKPLGAALDAVCRRRVQVACGDAAVLRPFTHCPVVLHRSVNATARCLQLSQHALRAHKPAAGRNALVSAYT